MALKEKVFFFVLTIVLALSSAGLVGAQDDEGAVAYRQKLMSSLGASMGSIGDMLKYKLPYDSKHVATHAQNVSKIGGLIEEAFKKEASANSGSKPEIWQEWDKFIAAAEAMSKAGAELAQAAEGGTTGPALMPQVKAVGDACKACHGPFRVPQ
jgi:cytochrome c556